MLLINCGGGGGGGKDLLQAAIVHIEADPTTIALGDRTNLTVRIDEVDENGVIVKIRYPKDILYIINTSKLRVDDVDSDVAPLTPQTLAKDRKVYLIYYFPRANFGDDNSGELLFQMRGVSNTPHAQVEVDVDLHSPSKDPEDEFDFGDPLYSAEDGVSIAIKSRL